MNSSYNAFYQTISSHYEGQSADRSGVPYINHIDEGLAVLKEIGAQSEAEEAYCLHPIVQTEYVREWVSQGCPLKGNEVPPTRLKKVLAFAFEYRSVANAYLSHRTIEQLEEIELSPFDEVNDMLIADKVQNRKDFELYHEGTHERSDELAQYFRNWLRRLGVSEERYQELRSHIAAL